jgi:D-sedoheptulose 7-phosphate isomerase
MTIFEKEFSEAQNVLRTFMAIPTIFTDLETIAQVMITALKNGNCIYSCGNGGSMTDAMHFAEELTGRFRETRKALPAIAISDSSFISCVANDFGYNEVFARFIQAVAKPGDILLAISTSGNSPNVLRAVEEAKKQGVTSIALTGKTGGELLKKADYAICVPHHGYADRIQEIHIKIIHTLIQRIEQEF